MGSIRLSGLSRRSLRRVLLLVSAALLTLAGGIAAGTQLVLAARQPTSTRPIPAPLHDPIKALRRRLTDLHEAALANPPDYDKVTTDITDAGLAKIQVVDAVNEKAPEVWGRPFQDIFWPFDHVDQELATVFAQAKVAKTLSSTEEVAKSLDELKTARGELRKLVDVIDNSKAPDHVKTYFDKLEQAVDQDIAYDLTIKDTKSLAVELLAQAGAATLEKDDGVGSLAGVRMFELPLTVYFLTLSHIDSSLGKAGVYNDAAGAAKSAKTRDDFRDLCQVQVADAQRTLTQLIDFLEAPPPTTTTTSSTTTTTTTLPTASVSGTVDNGSSVPIAGADVTYGPESTSGTPHTASGTSGETTTNAEGQYSVPDLPIGTYFITFTYSTDVCTAAGTSSNTAVVTLSGGEQAIQNASCTPPPPPSLSGQVTDGNGTPDTNATIQLGATGPTTTTDSNGDWSFPTSDLTNNTIYFLQVYQTTYSGVFTPPCTVGTGTPGDGYQYVTVNGPTTVSSECYYDNGISGTVAGAGSSVTRVLVSDTNTEMVVGSDGTYAFPNLLPGQYSMSVTSPTGYACVFASSGSPTATDTAVAGSVVTDNISCTSTG